MEKKITLEDLLAKVKSALEYGYILGYSECLNNSQKSSPKTSNPETAMKYHLQSLKEQYEQE